MFRLTGKDQNPVCLVWHDWESEQTHRIWWDELLKMKKSPFDVSERTICFTYYYGAEGSCHQALGWEHPTNVIDCFTEFRNRTNGAKVTMRQQPDWCHDLLWSSHDDCRDEEQHAGSDPERRAMEHQRKRG